MPSSAPLQLTLGGPAPSILFAIDSMTTSSQAALVAPLRELDSADVAVLAPAEFEVLDASSSRHAVASPHDIDGLSPNFKVVAAAGHFMRAGALAYAFARKQGLPYFIVQHGLLTPHAPPLPAGGRLLAWSTADGEFWRSGRGDVEIEAVGSQLLWNATQRGPIALDHARRPTFLGQLHGAEIPRREMAKVARQFCRTHGADYRPHPSEVDKASRLQHAIWQKQGIAVDSGSGGLASLTGGVVSVFSTGILEAAALGLPAWVYHPRPPKWVSDLWARYDLAQWGDEPTAPLAHVGDEPGLQIASILTQAAKA